MIISLHINDTLWNQLHRTGLSEKDVERITEEALANHLRRQKIYKKLLKISGAISWEANLDQLRGNRF